MNILQRNIGNWLTVLSILFTYNTVFSQCEVKMFASQYEIYCGQSVTFSATMQGADSVLLAEDFNSGSFGPGWSGTAGGVDWNNPCSPGVNGTTYVWFGSGAAQPRDLTSASYNLSTATAGVTICFDMLYATQGNPSPCEGPDEPTEGVHLQYSINNGVTWVDIHYWDPNGGYDPMLTVWNHYCEVIPAVALTSNTKFRWHQNMVSSNMNDHWGIDNPSIVINDPNVTTSVGQPGDPYYFQFPVGSTSGTSPNSVTPTTTTTYTVHTTSGDGTSCSDSVTIVVKDPIFDVIFDENPIKLCPNDTCVNINGYALQQFYPVFEDRRKNDIVVTQSGYVIIPGTYSGTSYDSIPNPGFSTITNGSITSVCIDSIILPTAGNCSNMYLANAKISLVCPSGSQITLANTGDMVGQSLSNICFQTGAPTIPSTGGMVAGSVYAPRTPFSNLNGCNANGVWKIVVSGSHNAVGCSLTGTVYGTSVTLHYADTVHNLHWDNDPTLSTLTDINTIACPTASTDYYINVSNGVPGCLAGKDTLKIIKSTELPKIDKWNITEILCHDDCNGSIGVQASSNAQPLTYQWLNGLNAPIGTNSPTIASICAGNYSLIVTDSNGCSITVDTALINPPALDPNFTFANFCQGDLAHPDNIATQGGTFSFNPQPNDGATINATTGVITNAKSGATYSVEYSTKNNCSSYVVNVSVFDKPNVSLSANPTQGNAPLTVNFQNTSTGNNVDYSWNFGDGNHDNNNNNLNVSHQYTFPGTFPSTLIGTSNDGCVDSAHVLIVVTPPNMEYSIPNVFTPNGDNSNEYFELMDPKYISSINVSIFNRWGLKVYESSDVNFKWNGKQNGKGNTCSDGTYFYKLILTGNNGQVKQEDGFVQLIGK